MNKRLQILTAVMLWACSGDGTDEPIPQITGTVSPEHPELNVSGEFSIYSAFAFNDQGTLWMYLSSNPETTCDDVVDYMTSTTPYDPVRVLSPGKCNMFIKISDWSGESVVKDDRLMIAQSNIECAMGEGQFELMTLEGDNEDDYYWNAQWWQGVPIGYEWSISGDRQGDESNPAGYTIDINLYAFDGGFIHLEPSRKYEGTGAVSGSMEAQICEGLASMGL